MVEIVSARTDLRRQGVRYTGLCPFHEERSPSFSVHSEEKLYHCFGCGVGGDLFDFVCETENIDFPAAVELLADRYGVEVTREQEDPRAEQRRKARNRMSELLERAAGFYSAFLWEAPEAAKAREYLESRGLRAEVLRDFGVGYAPSAWDTLIMRGQRAGFKVEELAATGLAQKGRSGGMYDRFRERITFPIRDARGRAVGFGARAMRPEQKPKYLNSAENELFHKSEILYGIDRARPAMAKAGRALVVEGYTDVLALHQAGLEETVGIMGTAITEQQIAQLSATVDTVILALDADAAGRKAMLRAQEVAAGRRLDDQRRGHAFGRGSGRDRDRRWWRRALPRAGRGRGRASGVPDRADPRRGRLGFPPGPRSRARGGGTGSGRRSSGCDAGRADAQGRRGTRNRPDGGGDPCRAGAFGGNGGGWRCRTQTPLRIPARRPRRGLPKRAGPMMRCSRAASAASVRCSPCASRSPRKAVNTSTRLKPDHLSSPLTARAVDWLKDHLDSPTEGLDPADRELSSLIAAMVMGADPAQVGEGSIRRNFMELELAALEDRMAVAAAGGDPAERAELNRRRSQLVDELRRAEAAGPGRS